MDATTALSCAKTEQLSSMDNEHVSCAFNETLSYFMHGHAQLPSNFMLPVHLSCMMAFKSSHA